MFSPFFLLEILFKSTIHFELIFTCKMRGLGWEVFYSIVRLRISNCYCIICWKGSLFPIGLLLQLCQKSVRHIHVGLSQVLSILFHWAICSFSNCMLSDDYIVSLNIRLCDYSHFILFLFFLQNILVILSPVHFHIHVWISLSMSIKNHAGILIGFAFNL